jgi:hypothetical protein
MSAIIVTALANAGANGQIKPVFPDNPPVIFQPPFGMTTDEPLDYCDDATTAQIAKLLNGQAIKVPARSFWRNADPSRLTVSNASLVPLQNYVGFAGQSGAPSGALMIVNAGDIAIAAGRGYYFMPRELAVEEVLAAMIPGATMSDAAAAALPTSPVSMWGNLAPIWYVPPVAAAPIVPLPNPAPPVPLFPDAMLQSIGKSIGLPQG